LATIAAQKRHHTDPRANPRRPPTPAPVTRTAFDRADAFPGQSQRKAGRAGRGSHVVLEGGHPARRSKAALRLHP
jgi:hypothetical protein